MWSRACDCVAWNFSCQSSKKREWNILSVEVNWLLYVRSHIKKSSSMKQYWYWNGYSGLVFVCFFVSDQYNRLWWKWVVSKLTYMVFSCYPLWTLKEYVQEKEAWSWLKLHIENRVLCKHVSNKEYSAMSILQCYG